MQLGGFDMKAVEFIYNYWRKRKQRTKIDNAYSSWQNIDCLQKDRRVVHRVTMNDNESHNELQLVTKNDNKW